MDHFYDAKHMCDNGLSPNPGHLQRRCQGLGLNLGPLLCLAMPLLPELPEMLDSTLPDPLDTPVLCLDFCWTLNSLLLSWTSWYKPCLCTFCCQIIVVLILAAASSYLYCYLELTLACNPDYKTLLLHRPWLVTPTMNFFFCTDLGFWPWHWSSV